MSFMRAENKLASSSAPAGISAVVAILAVTILGYSPLTWPAPLAESAVFRLEYREGMKRVAPNFSKNYGRYLGSGTGSIEGTVTGSVVWDLFEEQSDPNLHRTQFVGRITSVEGDTVSFETSGYFIPRPGDYRYWDLTSAVYFVNAKGAAYQKLSKKTGLWQGYVEIRSNDGDQTTYAHAYKLYLAGC